MVLLRVIAERITSCVEGPRWTPPSSPIAPSSSRTQTARARASAIEKPALDKFYIYDERDGPEFSLSMVRSLLGQASRDGNTPAWRNYVENVGSAMQHQSIIFLLDALLEHPARVLNATEAKWFVVPIGIDPKTPGYLLPPLYCKRWQNTGRVGGTLDVKGRIRHREALLRLTKSATWKARAADHVVLSGSWCAWTMCPGVEAHGMHRVLRAGGYVGTLDRRFTALETLGVAAWRERAPHADAQALYDASTLLLPYVSAPQFSKQVKKQKHRSFLFEGCEDRRGPGGAGRRLLPELAKHLPGSRVCFTRGSNPFDRGPG